MKPEKLVLELEQVIATKGFKIRREQGDFKGGQCVMLGEKLIVLNKKAPPETHSAILARFLFDQGIRDVYASPVVRKELISIWRKYPDFKAEELEDLA